MKSIFMLFIIISTLSVATEKLIKFKIGQIVTLPVYNKCLSKILAFDIEREQYKVSIKCPGNNEKIYFIEEGLIK